MVLHNDIQLSRGSVRKLRDGDLDDSVAVGAFQPDRERVRRRFSDVEHPPGAYRTGREIAEIVGGRAASSGWADVASSLMGNHTRHLLQTPYEK